MSALGNLPAGVRKGLFTVLAVVLVALAFFAARGPGQDAEDAPTPAVSSTTGRGTVVVAPEPQGTGTEGTGTQARAVPLPVGADIIADNAAVAEKFTQAFTTYRYDQDDKKAAQALAGMLDKNPRLNLTGVFPTGSFKASLVKQRYSTTSTAKTTQAVMVSARLLAFEVDATVTTRKAGVTSTKTETYLVTLTRESGWGVDHIELADDATGYGHD